MMHTLPRPSRQRGFSLLEMAITLGVAGTLMAGVWQMLGTASQNRDAATMASQALAVSAASQQYINMQRSSLLALGGLATLNSVVRVKIQDSDTGDTTDSVQGAGYLPEAFANRNGYGQAYQLYVRREDGGTLGSPDDDDKLVGLLITAGGVLISDTTGARVASLLAPAGGFLYADSNPAAPTAATTAQGANGAWQIDLTSTGWAGIGAQATAGRLAMLVNLTPVNASGGGGIGSGGAGATDIDGLSDGKTNYATLYNVFLGQDAGATSTAGGAMTGIGYQALGRSNPVTTYSHNTAIGYQALLSSSTHINNTGTSNTAVGTQALVDNSTGRGNTAIGTRAGYINQTGEWNTYIGYEAGKHATGSKIVAIGSQAGACINSVGTDWGNVESVNIGYQTSAYYCQQRNTLVGASIGGAFNGIGSSQTAIGAEALYNVSTISMLNVAIGYRAGYDATSMSGSILIGANANSLLGSASNFFNIGDLLSGTVGIMGVGARLQIGPPAALAGGISFDVSSQTNSVRIAVGTTAQRPTCASVRSGSIRLNTTDATMDLCANTTWLQPQTAPSGAAYPVGPATGGYFVMTAGSWDGNLGGLDGAHAKCLADLTANNWNGKADAVARSLLVESKVRAFLCAGTDFCTNGLPLTNYTFATSGDTTAGGAVNKTDSAGSWPLTNRTWSGLNYFNTAAPYWTNRAWVYLDDGVGTFGGDGCASGGVQFTSNSSALTGIWGDPNEVYVGRWSKGAAGYQRSCDRQLRLLCFVDP